MESASFQPQPPQQLKAPKSWLAGLRGAFLQPPPRRERCVRDGGEPMGTVWQVHSHLSIATKPHQGIFSPGASPVIQPRSRIHPGTSPPVLFFAPKGARASPYLPSGSGAGGAPTTQLQAAPAAWASPGKWSLILGSPISTSPWSSPGPAGDLARLRRASPALIRALNRADEGRRRVGGHQQPPPSSLPVLGRRESCARFLRPPNHFWRAN